MIFVPSAIHLLIASSLFSLERLDQKEIIISYNSSSLIYVVPVITVADGTSATTDSSCIQENIVLCYAAWLL